MKKTDIKSISLEEAKKMRLIPLNNIKYKTDIKNEKAEFFILSPDFKKMKTYNDYKLGVNKYVKFKSEREFMSHYYYLKGENHSLHNVYGYEIDCYTIKEFDEINDEEHLYTTTEKLDEFIKEQEKELKEEKKEKAKIAALKKSEQELFDGFDK